MQKYKRGTYILLVNKHSLVVNNGVIVDNPDNRFNGYSIESSRLVRVDATNDNTFRQGAVRGTGVTVPNYEAPLLNLTPKELDERIGLDLDLIHKMNPERDIYVAFLKDRTKIQFAFVPASDYRHSLNDVPQLNQTTSRRIRIQ